jgi:hypothetical protein
MDIVLFDEYLLSQIVNNIDKIKDVKLLRSVNRQFNKLLKDKFEELFKEKKTKVSCLTDCDIFKYCYWGDFMFNFDLITPIHNRNNFVKKHKIIKETIAPKYILDEVNKTYLINDHTEYYRTKDYYCIVITSPYIDKESKEYIEMIGKRWIKTKKLYTYGAISFYKKIYLV